LLQESADLERDKDEERDRKDIEEKLSVLYGEDWENKSPKELMDGKYFKEIPEFLLSKTKMLTGQTVSRSHNLHKKPFCLPDSDILFRFM